MGHVFLDKRTTKKLREEQEKFERNLGVRLPPGKIIALKLENNDEFKIKKILGMK